MEINNQGQATPPAIKPKKKKFGCFLKTIVGIVGVLVVLGIIGAFVDDEEEGGGGGGDDWKYTGEYFDSVFSGFPKDEGVVYQHFPRDIFLLSNILVPIEVMQATKNGNLVSIEDSDRVVWVETKRRYEDDEKLDQGYYIRRGSFEYETAFGAEKTVARYVEVTDKKMLEKIEKTKQELEAKEKAEEEAREAERKAEEEAREAQRKAEEEAQKKAREEAAEQGAYEVAGEFGGDGGMAVGEGEADVAADVGGGGGAWKYTGEYFDSVFSGFPKDEGVVYQHFPRAIFILSDVLVPIKVKQATKNGNLVSIEDSDRVVWVETKRRYEDGEPLDEGYYIRRGSKEYTTAFGAEKTVARYVEVTGSLLEKVKKQIEEEKAAAEAKAKAKHEAAIAKKKAEIAAMQAGTSAGEAKSITLPGGAKMMMVWCPAGTSMMGSNNGKYDERPVHEVTLTKGFWIAKTEVTQKQWKSVMGNNPSQHKGDDLPVENVSWNDCQEFCEKTGLQLPTEAQWEYACRGPYEGGGNLDDMGWYDDNSEHETHPVGQKRPNAWGLYDMHGNVWEWCADWYGDYPTRAVTDPKGASSGSLRVLRGGSWGSDAAFCRSASRSNYDPSGTSKALGFRPARVLSE